MLAVAIATVASTVIVDSVAVAAAVVAVVGQHCMPQHGSSVWLRAGASVLQSLVTVLLFSTCYGPARNVHT